MANANQINVEINSVLNSQANQHNLDKIKSSVNKARAAISAGNSRALAEAEAEYAKITGKKPAQAKIMVQAVVDPKTGDLTNKLKVDGGVLDPLLKAQEKAIKLHNDGEQAAKKHLQKLRIQKAIQEQIVKSQGGRLNMFSNERKELAHVNRQVATLEKALPQLTAPASLKGQLAEVNQQLSMTPRLVRDSATGLTKMNPKFIELRDKSIGLNKSLAATSAAAKGFSTQMRAVGAAVNTAMGIIGAIVASLAVLGAAFNTVIGRQKQLQQLALTLEGVGVSLGQQEAVMASAKEIALSYGVSLSKIEAAYKRLAPAILEAGGSLQDTEGAIESIAARTTMLGLNTEQAGRYIEAFAQVMGKGKLQGEELNQQFSELDGGLRGQLKNYFAATKGITDFEGAMKNSQITSALFLEAFEAINTEIRQNFLRSIDDTSQAINKMGQEGGMTIAQFMAKMDTLTKIGLEEVGKALAPLGAALAKIYAAFVQVFTKVATEMPGLQKLFQFLSQVVGTALVYAFNIVTLAIGATLAVIDKIVLGIEWLIEQMKKIPGVAWVTEKIGEGFAALTSPMDKLVDGFSQLSDETKGVDKELLSLEKELEAVHEQFKDTDNVEKYQAALDKINTKIAQKELRDLKAKLKEDLVDAEARKEEIEAQKEVEEEKLKIIGDALKEQLNVKKKALEEEKKGLEDMKKAAQERYKEEKEQIEETFKAKQEALDKEKSQIKENSKTAIAAIKARQEADDLAFKAAKTQLDVAKEAANERYDTEIAKIEKAKEAAQGMYDQQISELDNLISKVKARYDAELKGLSDAKKATQGQIAGLSKFYDKEIEKVNDKYDAIEAGLERQKEGIEATHEMESSRLEQMEADVESRYDSEINDIKDASDASARAHDRRQTELDNELRALDEVYSKVKDRINAERSASQAASDGRVGALEELTPAERQLKALDIYELKKKAADQTISSRERLEAKARLERMAREEQIEAERAAEALRQAEFERREREAEANHLAETERIENKQRALAEAERVRQEAFTQREAEALANKEAAMANIAAAQAAADAKRIADLAAIEVAERDALANREAEVNALEDIRDTRISRLEERLAQIDKAEKDAQAQRAEEVEELEEKKDDTIKALEARLEEYEKLEEDHKTFREEKLDEIEEKKDSLIQEEERRKREYDGIYERLKNDRISKEQAVDAEKERLKGLEEARLGENGLKGAYQELYDYYDGRLEDVDKKLEDIEGRQDDITTAIDASTTSQKDLKIATEATFGALETQLGLVNSIKTSYADISREISVILSKQRSLRATSGGSGSSTTTLQDSSQGGSGNSSDSLFLDGTPDFGPAGDASTADTLGNAFGGSAGSAIADSGADFGTQVSTSLNNTAEDFGTTAGNAWAQAQADRLNNQGIFEDMSPTWGRKSGGPVAGGATYKVNEQGQEGFLSSSGILSAIKTPRLGKWTAPSSGTVINAKAWSKIKKASGGSIPKDLLQRGMSRNGVNVSASSAGPSQGGVINSIMGALNGMASGDNFNNNITITSGNPTKSAGDMMVAMARMRHRR